MIKFKEFLANLQEGVALQNKIAEIRNQDTTPEELLAALDHVNRNVRIAAAGHANANSDVLDKALGDKSHMVHLAAIKNPNVTEKHLKRAYKFGNPIVQKAADERIAQI